MAETQSLTIAPPLAGHVLRDSQSDLVIVEWTDSGGGHEPPLFLAPPHIHHRDDEAWYVLEGTLHVRIDDQIHELSAGSGVLAPRGTVHTFWNPRPEPVRYLIVMTANIQAIIDELHALPTWSPDGVRDVMARHDTELR
jgi:mannose-6-phosphate isomerase-like protein (cupin superfamily)